MLEEIGHFEISPDNPIGLGIRFACPNCGEIYLVEQRKVDDKVRVSFHRNKVFTDFDYKQAFSHLCTALGVEGVQPVDPDVRCMTAMLKINQLLGKSQDDKSR